jgi:hypothetical protein
MPRASQKLSFRYFGPYQVLQRVGSVAYHLQLPAQAMIQRVVHISQLRLAAGFKGSVSSQLQSSSMQYRIPLQVLASR